MRNHTPQPGRRQGSSLASHTGPLDAPRWLARWVAEHTTDALVEAGPYAGMSPAYLATYLLRQYTPREALRLLAVVSSQLAWEEDETKLRITASIIWAVAWRAAQSRLRAAKAKATGGQS